MDWMFVLLSLASGLLFSIGDVLLKYWSRSSRILQLIIAIIFYIFGGLILALTFKRKSLAIAIAVLICFNMAVVAVAGHFLFNETIGLRQVVGLVLAAISVFILTL